MNSEQPPARRSTSRTLLTWVFATLLVVSAIWVLFSSFPARKILSPELYQQAFADANVYQKLPQAIALQMAQYLSPEGAEFGSRTPLVVLSEKEWEVILVDLIDPAWLQSQSDRIVDQFFEILLVSPDPANTPIDINVSQIKKNFAGQAGVQAINRIIQSQPPCSVDQLVGLVQVGLGMENSLQSILCRPPDFILTEINPLVESFLATAAASIPDEIQFFIPFSQFANLTGGTSDAALAGEIPGSVQTLRQANMLATWSPFLPLLFLLLLTMVAVRSLRDFMVWWGGVLFTAGLASLVLVAAFPPVMKWGIANYLPINFAELVNLPEIFISMGATDILAELVNQLQLSIILPAGVMTTIGFALLLGVFLLSRYPHGIADQQVQIPTVFD